MISVALCTYNGEQYIEEQLRSILNQTVPVDEIIICDDISTDKTVEKIREKIKKEKLNCKIKLSINESNLGVTKNFEKALSICNGDYIFLSDQDDVWKRDKVEKTINRFNGNPNCLLAFSDALLVDSAGKDLGRSLWEITKPPLKEKYSILDFTGARFVTGATVAIRKELLDYTLPMPECWIHDAWLAINASLYGEIDFIEEKLIDYRQHQNNIIGARKRTIIEQIKYTRDHIDKSIKFRQTMNDRFSSLYTMRANKMNTEEKKNILKCIKYWEETGSLLTNTKRHRIIIVLTNIINGNYRRYNHGLFGAMVDMYIIFWSQRTYEY